MGAIAIDVVCLLVLGPLGWFRVVPLVAINVALALLGLRVRPWLDPGAVGRPHIGLAGGLLVALIWAAPVLLQLASPVPTFLDVLPSYVAPIAHLHAYGTWGSLVVSPSPVFSPSSIFLGHVGLLGSLGVMTGLPPALAVSAFATPLLICFAAAGRALARTLWPASVDDGGLQRTTGRDEPSCATRRSGCS